MSERFDVVVVGARCAGSPLAALLARKGVRVALVERVTFPKDTLSTHVFEADGLAFLDRLGVTERLRGTGAPFVVRSDNRTGDFRVVTDWPQIPGDVGGIASVRRLVLDPILSEAAEEAGADVRMGAKVTGLLEEGGRVAGVRVENGAGGTELRARLVVGADGRNSTIAKLAGARRYNLVSNQRALYWTFFEDADTGPEPTFVFHRWSDRLVLGIPADSGLYQVLAMPDLRELASFRANLEERFMEHARSCEPIAQAIAGARRVGKFFGSVKWTGYFREAAGPGWALVGDAGHFKDPAVGRGISDAFHQVEVLASEIAAALNASPGELDEATARWWRWRDREYADYYWFAQDFGRGGELPSFVSTITRRLWDRGKFGLALDMQSHRANPQKVLPPQLPGAAAELLRERKGQRLTLVREIGTLLARDTRHRWLNRRPAYAEDVPPREAGLTEIEDNAAAPAAAAAG